MGEEVMKRRNKTWLGKTLVPRDWQWNDEYCTWKDNDESVYVYYKCGRYCAHVSVICADIESPFMKTESAARKNVERQLNKLFNEIGVLRGYVEDENYVDDGDPLGNFGMGPFPARKPRRKHNGKLAA
jgi:hypothetical protein